MKVQAALHRTGSLTPPDGQSEVVVLVVDLVLIVLET